jgi:DNA replication and repair protein RecF
MYLDTISLTNFRNYQAQIFKFAPYINLIIGDNGQGKSSLLEAISLFAYTKSLVANSDQELIKFAQDYYNLQAKFIAEQQEIFIKIFTGKKYKKSIIVNEEKLSKISQLVGLVKLVYLYPKYLNLIIETSSGRRKYLDMLLSQLQRPYFDILQSYNKFLAQKNKYLKLNKKQIDYGYLETLNEKLLDLSCEIIFYRKNIINKINGWLNKITAKYLSKDINIHLTYHQQETKSEIAAFLKEQMQQLLKKEIYRQTALWGPHVDKFNIFYSNQLLEKYGSLGQKRLSALLLKLIEVLLIKEYHQKYPILLADDVFLDLDEKNQKIFAQILHNFPTQIFITTTNPQNCKLYPQAKIIFLKNGKMRS